MRIVSDRDILGVIFDRVSTNGCAIGLDFSSGAPLWTHFSYNQEFLDRYHADNLAARDETLRFGLMGAPGYAFWTDLRQTGDPSSFIVAEKFGITEGVCLSVEVSGARSVASISCDPDQRPCEETIQYLRLLMSRATSEIASGKHSISKNALDYISAAANGLDSSDAILAETLDLSIHGARSRRRSALAEIGAKSPAHAVYIAAERGLISTYL